MSLDLDISVIIPLYNRAHLISETIDSILSQTYPPYEIIVVDDHSTDYPERVLSIYDNVRVVKSFGKGPGAARNTGMHFATGELIQFFDSDDVMSANKLESQVNIFNDYPETDIVYGPYIAVVKQDNQWEPKDVCMQYHPLPKGAFIDFVVEGWCNITQSCLFKRSFLDRCLPWIEDVITYEDKWFWYQVSLQTPTMHHEKRSMTYYRQHEYQVTNLDLSQIERTQNGIYIFEKIAEDIKRYNVSLHSRLMLFGMLAGYKKFLKSKQFFCRFSFWDRVFNWYYKLNSKIGRYKTNSDWQPMHGIEQKVKI